MDISEKFYKKNKYEFIGRFYDGLALVKNEVGYYGFINELGQEVIKCIYDHAWNFSEGLALVQKKSKRFFINTTGNKALVLPNNLKPVGPFKNGRCSVMDVNIKRYGYIDKVGNVVIPCQFVKASDFSDGLALVDMYGRYGYCHQLWYIDVKDRSQQQLIGIYKVNFKSLFSNGIALVDLYVGDSKDITQMFYIDKDRIIYIDEDEVKNLLYPYHADSSILTSPPKFKPEQLVYYCVCINFLGNKIELKANSESELMELRKQTYLNFENQLDTFRAKELSKYVNNNSQKQKIYRKKKINK